MSSQRGDGGPKPIGVLVAVKRHHVGTFQCGAGHLAGPFGMTTRLHVHTNGQRLHGIHGHRPVPHLFKQRTHQLALAGGVLAGMKRVEAVGFVEQVPHHHPRVAAKASHHRFHIRLQPRPSAAVGHHSGPRTLHPHGVVDPRSR